MSEMAEQPPQSAAAERGQLQTLHRAFDLLERLAQGGEAGLSTLSDNLGLARTTTHRLLATLSARGYVRQDPGSGRYRMGVRAFELGAAFAGQNPLRELARPILRELNQQFNETITLAVLDDEEAVYLDLAESSQTLRTFARVGARVPLHCTGVGKALLTGLGPAETARLLRGRALEAYTPATVTSLDALVSEVQRARETGYILDREEFHPGVRCAASPVLDQGGQVAAALSASGPAYRFTDKVWQAAARAVAAAAQELSRQLGYRTPARTRR